MPSANSLKKWKKFGLNEKTEICRLNVADLIIALGDKNSGFVGTYHDILNEKFSHSYSQPAQVCWIREEDKFLVTDGYHRILQRMLKGEASFLCEIDWSGYSLKWYLPTLNERFNLNMLGAFKKQPTRNKQMKITKKQLKQIIKEELLKEAQNPRDLYPDNLDMDDNDYFIEREYMTDIDDAVLRALQDPNVEQLHQIAYTLEDNLQDVYKAIEQRGAQPGAKLGQLKLGRQ